MVSILIMNGPNLNLLGTRQPEVYGATTLKEIEAICGQQAQTVGATVTFFQSNHEGDLIDQIHAARGTYDGIILNAGALSHTSIAIMDAIKSVEIPTIDMHLSNIHRREEFRSVSYVAKAAIGSIAGFGPGSYLLAIDAMMMHLGNGQTSEKEETPVERAQPLTTTREQMLHGDAADPDVAPALETDAEDPVAEAEPEYDPEPDEADNASALADEIAAATASAIESQKLKIEAAVKGLAADRDVTKDYEAKSDAAPESEPKPTPESKAEAQKPTSGFNEMFDTPSKEVLDSLGIAAPELNPPGKKEEAPKPTKTPLRSFRKFS